jgi:hypothetical protein
MSANVISLRAGVKSRGTIDAIAVKECHRRHLKCNGAFNELFRLRRSLKKTEGACGMQLYVLLSHGAPQFASGLAPGHE